MPVAVAPEIVALGVLLIAFLLVMLRMGWVATFGKLLSAASAAIRSLPSIAIPLVGTLSFDFLATIIDGINHYALAVLGAGISRTEWAAKRLFDWAAYILQETARVVGDLADDTYASVRQLRRWTVPLLIAQAIKPLAQAIAYLEAHAKRVIVNPTQIVNKVVTVTSPAIGVLEREVAKLRAQVAAIPASVHVPAIHVTVPGTTIIYRGVDDIRKRLGRIVRTLTPAGILGLTAAAVFSLRAGWLKCSNVNRLAKQACVSDSALIDKLIADSLVIFGTLSLVQTAKDMQGLIDAAAPEIRRFWRV